MVPHGPARGGNCGATHRSTCSRLLGNQLCLGARFRPRTWATRCHSPRTCWEPRLSRPPRARTPRGCCPSTRSGSRLRTLSCPRPRGLLWLRETILLGSRTHSSCLAARSRSVSGSGSTPVLRLERRSTSRPSRPAPCPRSSRTRPTRATPSPSSATASRSSSSRSTARHFLSPSLSWRRSPCRGRISTKWCGACAARCTRALP